MIALLVIIYVSFIGVGLPDSLLGVAWPAIYTEFTPSISTAGFISMTVSACTTISSLVSAKLNARFGTGSVTAFSTVLTVIALFGFALSPNITWMFLMAIPLGLGAGAIDSGLNNFVALHYSAAQMNFLHCFYGMGVALSPYLMSMVLGVAGNWRRGYILAAWIQAGIAAITIFALPIWHRHENKAASSEEEQLKLLSIPQMLKIPAVRFTCLVFFASCALELTFGSWVSTYFVSAKDVSPSRAAQITMLFYIGLTLGRFLSGILVVRLSEWTMIVLSGTVLLTGIVGLTLPVDVRFAAAALFLAGLGVGPLFPNLLHLTPINFGKNIASSIMGLQMTSTYIGIMTMPPLFGLLAQQFGIAVFPFFQMAMYSLCVLGFAGLIRTVKTG